jgi:gamma-glutamyl:cysteine ligase YbdK (ATP-grasp superfamily)
MTLRITVHEEESLIKLTLEGRLVGPWVAELYKAWRETAPRIGSKKMLLNLHDLTFSDEEGKQVLREIVTQTSAEISSSTPLTKYLAQEISTPKTN